MYVGLRILLTRNISYLLTPGFPCVFPFDFMGKTHCGCNHEEENNIVWCPTVVDALGKVIEGQGGICSPDCPIQSQTNRMTSSSYYQGLVIIKSGHPQNLAVSLCFYFSIAVSHISVEYQGNFNIEILFCMKPQCHIRSF